MPTRRGIDRFSTLQCKLAPSQKPCKWGWWPNAVRKIGLICWKTCLLSNRGARVQERKTCWETPTAQKWSSSWWRARRPQPYTMGQRRATHFNHTQKQSLRRSTWKTRTWLPRSSSSKRLLRKRLARKDESSNLRCPSSQVPSTNLRLSMLPKLPDRQSFACQQAVESKLTSSIRQHTCRILTAPGSIRRQWMRPASRWLRWVVWNPQ